MVSMGPGVNSLQILSILLILPIYYKSSHRWNEKNNVEELIQESIQQYSDGPRGTAARTDLEESEKAVSIYRSVKKLDLNLTACTYFERFRCQKALEAKSTADLNVWRNKIISIESTYSMKDAEPVTWYQQLRKGVNKTKNKMS